MLIRAEFSAFNEAERRFQETLWEFESVLDALEAELELSLSRWEGDAQKAYSAARSRWDGSAQDMRAELARLHKALGRAHRNLRSASDTNVRMWSA